MRERERESVETKQGSNNDTKEGLQESKKRIESGMKQWTQKSALSQKNYLRDQSSDHLLLEIQQLHCHLARENVKRRNT